MTSLVGHGLLVLANGDKYEGMFDNDKKHGVREPPVSPVSCLPHLLVQHGRFQWGDGPWKGHAYDGEWVSDVMEVRAMVRFHKLTSELSQGKGSYITSMRK
mmetsp:Transcript_18943/g.62270  ORF Transcript_18943/g.62270 Transcript_18943/m.62270 type:complete len:101 (+) Transcript_18943:813-1115(+)